MPSLLLENLPQVIDFCVPLFRSRESPPALDVPDVAVLHTASAREILSLIDTIDWVRAEQSKGRRIQEVRLTDEIMRAYAVPGRLWAHPLMERIGRLNAESVRGDEGSFVAAQEPVPEGLTPFRGAESISLVVNEEALKWEIAIGLREGMAASKEVERWELIGVCADLVRREGPVRFAEFFPKLADCDAEIASQVLAEANAGQVRALSVEVLGKLLEQRSAEGRLGVISAIRHRTDAPNVAFATNLSTGRGMG